MTTPIEHQFQAGDRVTVLNERNRPVGEATVLERYFSVGTSTGGVKIQRDGLTGTYYVHPLRLRKI